jgi:hypothetical protein
MKQPVKFGLNVDPDTGGLPIAERITATADASGLDLVGIQAPATGPAGAAADSWSSGWLRAQRVGGVPAKGRRLMADQDQVSTEPTRAGSPAPVPVTPSRETERPAGLAFRHQVKTRKETRLACSRLPISGSGGATM